MRHLIVCCDGTWNAPDEESVTNVRRLRNALADTDDAGNKQLSRYVPGVGAEGGLVPRLLGGGLGVGLSGNVIEGYHWLITTYQSGDSIELFGFSRGAYTARSLAGLIAMCGLIDTTGMDEETTWSRIKDVYRRYRRGHGGDARWRAGLTFRYDPDDEQIPLDFIGVWDTVGSLGIPDNLRWVDPLYSPSRYAFHDVKLNPHVRHARHAVAMDERRGAFSPTLWQDWPSRQDVKQVWFPGGHMDVGGGHLQTGLSDRALQWMIDEVREAVQLGFHKETTADQIRPDPLDVLHNDNRCVFGWLNPVLAPRIEPFLALRPRAVPLVDPHASTRSPELDDSAYKRQGTPPITSGPYRPTRVLAPGDSELVEVFAHEPWNETGLYLEAGDYDFMADGEWLDRDVPSGPDGARGFLHWQQPAERTLRGIGTLIGAGEKLYRRVTGQEDAYFPLAPREPDLPWMSLVGYVANDAVAVKRTPQAAHERIAIGAGTNHHVTKGGYFYAFANDAWGCYDNNHGSVRLWVARLSAARNSEPREQGKRP